MNHNELSPAKLVKQDVRSLMQRGFQNGTTLAALCRATAAHLEAQGASVARPGAEFAPATVAFLCLMRGDDRTKLMVQWLNAAARRLDKLPKNAEELEAIMGSSNEAFATFVRNVFGEGEQ